MKGFKLVDAQIKAETTVPHRPLAIDLLKTLGLWVFAEFCGAF
jgi:hypothetical protein